MIKTQHGMLIKISNTACVEIESLARCVQMKTRQLSSKSTLTIRHSNIQRLILLSVSVRQHHTKLAYGLLRKREMGSGFFRVHQFFYQFTSSHAVFTISVHHFHLFLPVLPFQQFSGSKKGSAGSPTPAD